MHRKTRYFLLAALALLPAFPSPAAEQEDTSLCRVRRLERPAQEKRPVHFAPQERLAYTFFEGNAYTAAVRRVSVGHGGVQVVESLSEDGSVAVISVYTPGGERHEARDMKRGRVCLAVSQPDGTFEVREYDLTLQRHLSGEPPAIPPGVEPAPLIRGETDHTTIDLMIVADKSARSWANKNHAGGLEAVAYAAVARMNLALANSGIACTVRLVRIYEPDYTYTGGPDGMSGLLTNLQLNNGTLNDVTTLRNHYGADLVTMFVDTGHEQGTTGIGYSFGYGSAYAYSVCSIRSVNISHTMSHEVGHNFGCGHSKVQAGGPGGGYRTYAAGLHFTGTDGVNYHTVMAYNFDGHTSILYTGCDYFSTPLKTYQGVSVGDAEDADNARCISETMATIAAYREAIDLCAVSLDAQGGKVTPSKIDVLHGETYGALPVPSREGYLFDGWWTEPDGGGERISPDTVIPEIRTLTLYAKWLKSCTLTLKEGLTDRGESVANVLAGSVQVIHANDKTPQGLVFEKWTASPANTSLGTDFNPMSPTTQIVMPDKNITLTATYISAPGYLQVYVKPDNAQGIQWSKDSGKTWTDASNDGEAYPVKTGNCTITFRASDPGWLAPPKTTTKITAMATNTVTAVALAPRLVGTFTGWLADDEDRVCGTLSVTIGATGKTTAKAVLTNATFSLTAPAWSAGAGGDFGIALATPRGETLTLAFDSEQPSGIFPFMAGTLTGGTLGAASFPALAQRNAFAKAKDPDNSAAVAFVKPYSGYYTVLLNPGTINPGGLAESRLEGCGYLGLTINEKKGTAKTAGKLPDGTAISFSPTVILADDSLLIPCFALLYSKRGFYSAVLTLDEETHITGEAFWAYPGKKPTAKPPQTEDRFTLTFSADGGLYSPLTATGACFTALSPVTHEPPVADVPFAVDPAGKARFPKTSDTLANPQKVTFKLTPKTGLFKGKFTLAQDPKAISVSHWGMIVPNATNTLQGAGFYIVPDTWTNPLNAKDRYSIRHSFSILITADE